MSREYVIEGGGLAQLILADRLRSEGNEVLLLVPETYLGREICSPGRYLLTGQDLPLTGSQEEKIWKEWTPFEVWQEPGQLHPDRFKRRLEDWCGQKGIRYFYQVKLLSVKRTKEKGDGGSIKPLRIEGCAKCGRPVFFADAFVPAAPDREERNTAALPLTQETEGNFRARILYVEVKKEEEGTTGSFLERAAKERIPHGRCHGCITSCRPGETPYCITEALIAAVRGDVENGLLFAGENAWKARKMEHVAEIMEELSRK